MLPNKTKFVFSRQEWALIAVTLVWGATFLVVAKALTVTGPLFMVGLRFAFSTLSILCMAPTVMPGITRRELFAGVAIGVCISIGYGFQTFGLQSITSSKSAFITAFYVPLVPVMQWLCMRRRPSFMQWVGVALALLGLIFITMPEEVGTGFGSGEILTMIGTVGIAMEILLISIFAGSVNIHRVTIVQLFTASVLSFAAMIPLGEAIPSFSWLLLITAAGLGAASAIIQIAMNWAQKTVSPTRATIIYAGEPVWAGIFGRIAGERLPAAAILGGALVVAGVLVSEMKLRLGPGKVEVPEEKTTESKKDSVRINDASV